MKDAAFTFEGLIANAERKASGLQLTDPWREMFVNEDLASQVYGFVTTFVLPDGARPDSIEQFDETFRRSDETDLAIAMIGLGTEHVHRLAQHTISAAGDLIRLRLSTGREPVRVGAHTFTSATQALSLALDDCWHYFQKLVAEDKAGRLGGFIYDSWRRRESAFWFPILGSSEIETRFQEEMILLSSSTATSAPTLQQSPATSSDHECDDRSRWSPPLSLSDLMRRSSTLKDRRSFKKRMAERLRMVEPANDRSKYQLRRDQESDSEWQAIIGD